MPIGLAPRRMSDAVATAPVPRRLWLSWVGAASLTASLTVYWLSVWSRPRYFSMIDTRVYLAGAQVFLHGGRLYAMRTTGAHLQFTYPPAAAVLFSWMPMVGLWWTKVASTAFSQCAFIGCVWLMLRWLQVPRPARWGTTGLAASGLLWLEPVQATLHFGQVNLLVMLLILADLTRHPRWIPPGALIGAAAGLKLVPAIFIAYLLIAGRWRAACVAIGVFAGSVALGFATTPMQSIAYWTRFAFDTGRIGSVAHVSNQSMYGMLAASRAVRPPPTGSGSRPRSWSAQVASGSQPSCIAPAGWSRPHWHVRAPASSSHRCPGTITGYGRRRSPSHSAITPGAPETSGPCWHCPAGWRPSPAESSGTCHAASAGSTDGTVGNSLPETPTSWPDWQFWLCSAVSPTEHCRPAPGPHGRSLRYFQPPRQPPIHLFLKLVATNLRLRAANQCDMP